MFLEFWCRSGHGSGKVPDPYLSSACAPVRLLISGDIRSWKVNGLEDMRVLSHSQLHAAVDEADWHVHLFGFCQDDMEVDRALPGSASSASAASRRLCGSGRKRE